MQGNRSANQHKKILWIPGCRFGIRRSKPRDFFHHWNESVGNLGMGMVTTGWFYLVLKSGITSFNPSVIWGIWGMEWNWKIDTSWSSELRFTKTYMLFHVWLLDWKDRLWIWKNRWWKTPTTSNDGWWYAVSLSGLAASAHGKQDV